MLEKNALNAFAALSQETRLRIVRHWMVQHRQEFLFI